jgi:hypothetical protein
MYSLEDYYQKRDQITTEMTEALTTGLFEKMNVEVVMFQLNFVQLPSVVLQRLLNIGIQSQVNIKESYVQNATIIRQETKKLVNQILANATVINATATSESSFITQNAQAQSFKMLQDAKRIAYAQLFQDLNLNTTELQLSFLYVTGISSSDADIKMLVDVNSVLIQS